MPQINEYLPDTGAQGAVGGVTPNLEAVSLFGRGVEHIGGAVDEAADVVHRRQAQQEVSQVYGQFAQARADWNVTLKQRLRDGTLDPDKYDQEYADYINKAGDGLQTAEGKDFFNRQANRLGGDLMQKAIVGKARIAGEQAYQDISQGINVHVANLMSHPDDAPAAIDSTQELIAAKQKDGTLSPEEAIRLNKEMLPQLAEAAVKGMAEQDPGKDASGKPYTNKAEQFLNAGGYAEYLNEPQRSALYQYSRAADNRRRIDEDREDTDAQRQRRKEGQDFMDSNAARILQGQMSTKEIMAGPGSLQQKEYMVAKVKAANNEEAVTNKRDMSNTYGKILNGDITTRDQLEQMWLKHEIQIAPHDMPFLEHQIDNTPDGLMVKKMQKGFDKLIDKQYPGALGNMPAVAAVKSDIQMEFLRTQQEQAAQGVSARQFWSNTNLKDPNSPYAILNRHHIQLPDLMNMQAQQMQNDVTGQGTDPNINRYSNSPTKEVPPVQGPEQAPLLGPENAPPAPPPEKAPERGVLDPNPNDSPEVAANRARNKKDYDDAMAVINKIKSSDIVKGMSNLSFSSGAPKAQANAPAIPDDERLRPGESISAWKKRTGK